MIHSYRCPCKFISVLSVLSMIFFSDLEDSLPDAMKEMFDMEFDFPPRTHCLSRWYYALANNLLLKDNSLHGKFIIISPSCLPFRNSSQIAYGKSFCLYSNPHQNFQSETHPVRVLDLEPPNLADLLRINSKLNVKALL